MRLNNNLWAPIGCYQWKRKPRFTTRCSYRDAYGHASFTSLRRYNRNTPIHSKRGRTYCCKDQSPNSRGNARRHASHSSYTTGGHGFLRGRVTITRCTRGLWAQ